MKPKIVQIYSVLPSLLIISMILHFNLAFDLSNLQQDKIQDFAQQIINEHPNFKKEIYNLQSLSIQSSKLQQQVQHPVVGNAFQDVGCNLCMTIAGTLNATVQNYIFNNYSKFNIELYSPNFVFNKICDKIFQIQNNFVLPILKTIFTFGCSLTQYDSLTCRGMIDYFVDLGTQQLFEMPLGPGNICQNYLRICEIEDLRVLDITQYQNQILKSKPQNVISDNFINEEYERINLFDGSSRGYLWQVKMQNQVQELFNYPQLSSSRPVIKMLHLADLHLDFKYMAGSASICNNIICCREVNGIPDDSKKKAGIYGSYYCDAPKKLMYSMIEYINANIGPDFIVWTGDSTPHTEFEKIGFEEKQTYLTWLNDLFKTNMSSATMYPAPGNHDFSVSNMQDFTKAEPLLEQQNNKLKDCLKRIQFNSNLSNRATSHKILNLRMEEFLKMLFQSPLIPNLAICSISTYGPRGTIQAVNLTGLYLIEAKNQMAIIFGHVPIGNIDCNYGWSVRFKAIADRFQHIIRFSVYGHVHEEQHYINRAVKSDKPVGVSYLTGSVTPYENINPSFRLFELDVETMLPLRIQTHFKDSQYDNYETDYNFILKKNDSIILSKKFINKQSNFMMIIHLLITLMNYNKYFNGRRLCAI